MGKLEWLERISSADVVATANTRTVVNTGAFKLLLDPVYDFAGMNWATPLKSLLNDFEITALCEAFHSHGRVPRLEFIAKIWQGVAAALEKAGFQSEGEPQDIMLVTPDTFMPFAASHVQIRFLEADDHESLFQSFLETQTQGFGYSSDPPTNDQIAALLEQIRAGRRAALAFVESRVVGAATTLGKQLAELQGVTTLPSARRRGVAARISSVFVADVFESGGDAVWLSVEDAVARACYAKLGFRVIGSRLNYSNSVSK